MDFVLSTGSRCASSGAEQSCRAETSRAESFAMRELRGATAEDVLESLGPSSLKLKADDIDDIGHVFFNMPHIMSCLRHFLFGTFPPAFQLELSGGSS